MFFKLIYGTKLNKLNVCVMINNILIFTEAKRSFVLYNHLRYDDRISENFFNYFPVDFGLINTVNGSDGLIFCIYKAIKTIGEFSYGKCQVLS